ncbi:YggS family pyridoxal phosphate-dependent enzyme [Enterococcus italicus]|uniref:YggS family pyridoxal phosphate-dependent enzyme n=1 Tax=Enterococcus italicus TaxID=246144 RepID=UPI0020731452|nr:YggS family pyridoxal phosphate-dependent enzyme [Enterococcus italicus]MCM6932379.1 YggS family pyridoxal phosphate-dependent enzyme [Enterococcus italicus]
MISENLRKVEQEVQKACALASRQRESVTLVAVTKTVDLETTIEVVTNGVIDCAENRVEPFLAKKEAMKDLNVTWHFIGNLQRRKVKRVINEVDYFHALESLSLANEIQKRATKKIRCFIEVNVSGEESKQGIKPSELSSFVEQLSEFDKVEIVGLMTMAPFQSTKSEQRDVFLQLRNLQKSIEAQQLMYAPCHELSMGMSNDYTVAIEEGATFIRVGTALVKE